MIQVKKRLLHCIVVWSLFFVSCKSSVEPHPLPDAPVRLTLDLSGADFALREPLATVEIHSPRMADEYVGLGGVVVVHGLQASTGSQYYAYDLACPVEVPGISVVRHTTDPAYEGLVLYRCPSCGSVYELALGIGNPITGAARHPLKQYGTALAGDMLRVFNR
ncbi:hypothetical protein [Porphyromonas sp.]|uniref:hypothetical protein n=1 Tax=Porphyromonas sp. TaxID=1924944 RepID=UPI0026DAD833|nr:hypothetical protein [Porphyromonas sp.]MDO4771469.1 hypothetical protein [Porphyromonas sp.]